MKTLSKHQYNPGFNSFMSRYRAKYIKELVRNKKLHSIIDLGCGFGDVIKELDKTSNLISKAEKVVLVDFDQYYIKQAKRAFSKRKNFTFVSLNLEKNFKLEGFYDLIIMVDIIEHLKKPLKVLVNVKKILSPNGQLIIITPNAKALHRRIGKHMGIINSVYELGEADFRVGHVKLYDHSMLRKLAKKAGYKKINTGGILLKPFQNSKMIKLEENYIDALYETGKELPDFCGEAVLVCS